MRWSAAASAAAPVALEEQGIELCAGASGNADEAVAAYLRDSYGRPVPVMVTAKDEKTITFDANHEMAGKELNFTIELVEVRD